MSRFLMVSENGRVEPLADSGSVIGGLETLKLTSQIRTDAAGRVRRGTFAAGMRAFEMHVGEAVQRIQQYAEAMRGDSGFAGNMGMLNPRDLTHRFREVLTEAMPPLNMALFPVNTEPPPGTLHYEQYRAYSTGEAVVYKGGSGADIPEVGIGQATLTSPIVYLVSKATINWLETLSTNLVGLDVQARKMQGMQRVIAELENKWTFEGAPAHGLYGLLNHPYVDTALSGVAWVNGTDGDDIAEDFGRWANYAENESGSTFQPNTLLIAPKLANWLRNRKYADDASKSLMDWMLGANPHITRVETVRELNDAGGQGIHAMFFGRLGDSRANSSMEIVRSMTPTLLPPDARTLTTELFMASGFGGLNQREVGDALLVFVESDV